MLQTVSIPLLPALTSAFDTSIASVSWVATSTLIVGAAANPIIGRVGDMYGKRRSCSCASPRPSPGASWRRRPAHWSWSSSAAPIQGLGSGVIPLAYGVDPRRPCRAGTSAGPWRW